MLKRCPLIACLFFYAVATAQQYPFVHYTPKDGLVNSRVRKAYQDSKGRMYFMTFGGLSVYDGTRFKNYTVQNGLASDLVNDILEMDDDSTWVACNTGRLNYLRNGKARTLNTADGFCPIINSFLKSKDGSVYAVADEGLFLFQKDRFARLPFVDSRGRDAGKFLTHCFEWNRYLIILSDPGLSGLSPANLFVYDKISREIIAEEKKEYIFAACIDNNKIYLATSRGITQLDTTALQNREIHYLPVPEEYKNDMPVIDYMYLDKQHNFWLCSGNKKIIKIDSLGSRKEFSMDNGLSSNDFSSIFQDREGSIWITMNAPGVDKLVNDNIELYRKFKGFHINDFFADNLSDSVYLYADPGKKIITLYQGRLIEQGYEGEKIISNAFSAHHGKIYMSDGRNLFLFHQNNHPTLKKQIVYKVNPEVGLGKVFIDPYENLVICGHSFLTVILADTFIFRYPMQDFIDQVAYDKKNRLWMATRSGKLNVLKINPGDPSNYLESLKKYDKNYPALAARSLTVDNFNNVWIGTRDDGLFCFHFDDQLAIRLLEHYTIKEGLSDNFITHLTCDNDNIIWASTAGGLDKIRYQDNHISIENITRSSYIYDHILRTCVTKSGIAWSYTSDGNLIRISKHNGLVPVNPSLIITELKIGNINTDSLLYPASFSYKQNTFSISVAAPSFYDEKQVKYSYWLQGSGNNQWSEPSDNPTFNFISLNPGNYLLKIKASFPAGRYPDQVIDYAFIIHPPWWQKWWFRILAGLSIIGLLWTGIRTYYRNKLERQRINAEKKQAVEKERTRIATDIHDDLGSGLSRIRYLGEMVKLKTLQQQNILPDIEKIAVFSDEMVDKMNEIVWALNEKNDSLEAIIAYTRSFAAEYLSNNNLLCAINLPEEIPHCIIKGETRRNIFLSVKECLHNIIKHAGATETIITFSVGNQLIIQIQDNGRGINWETTRPFSNGIVNIKQRMKEAGGTVDFKNEKGTTVILRIPL